MANIVKINGKDIKDVVARNEVADLKSAIEQIEPGLSDDAKVALLDCLNHMEWVEGDGSAYIRALKTALNMSDRDPDLPDAYDQVTYIESTGTQYIQTNLLTRIPMRVVASMVISGTAQPTVVGGGVSSVPNSRFFLVATPYDSRANHIGNRFANDTVSWTEDGNTYTSGWLDIRSFVASNTEKYDIESGIEYASSSGKVRTYIECNGYSVEGERNTPTVGYPICFFYQSNADVVVAGTLYSCKIYTSNSLIFNAVPCVRKSDNTPGVYDTISGEFYTNAGTGTFEVGEIVE